MDWLAACWPISKRIDDSGLYFWVSFILKNDIPISWRKLTGAFEKELTPFLTVPKCLFPCGPEFIRPLLRKSIDQSFRLLEVFVPFGGPRKPTS